MVFAKAVPGTLDQKIFDATKFKTDTKLIQKYLDRTLGKNSATIISQVDSFIKENNAHGYYIRGLINLANETAPAVVTHEQAHHIDLMFGTKMDHQVLNRMLNVDAQSPDAELARIEARKKGEDVAEAVHTMQMEARADAIAARMQDTGRGFEYTVKGKVQALIDRIIQRFRDTFGNNNPMQQQIDTMIKQAQTTAPAASKKTWHKDVAFQKQSTGQKEDQAYAQDMPAFQTSSDGLLNGINVNKLNIDDAAKTEIKQQIDDIRDDLENIAGEPLTHSEIMLAAHQAKVMDKAISREDIKKMAASILALRKQLAASAEGNGISEDFIKNLVDYRSQASSAGRLLNSLKINADPDLNLRGEDQVKADMVEKIMDTGVEIDTIVEAAKTVDFSDHNQAVKFYRSFVKPTFNERLSLFRYVNMLSSPLTHIKNTFSNILQLTVTLPLTKTTAGLTDPLVSHLPKQDRENYLKEVPKFYQGAFSGKSLKEASKLFSQAISGKVGIENLDMRRIPTSTNRATNFIPRMLEGSDRFFSTLVKNGEVAAIRVKVDKSGRPRSEALIQKQAEEKSTYTVFRKRIDPSNKTGQGIILSDIDKLTNGVMKMRDNKYVGWFVPFVETPMNILKQGIEYSPAGLATIPGSKYKNEQFAKSITGSMVYALAAVAVVLGDATWSPPTDEEEKAAFYASGRKPYSIKIGDKWLNFQQIGPLGYPIALAAAVKHEWTYAKDAERNNLAQKFGNLAIDMTKYTADQSYFKGLGNLIDALKGTPGAVDRTISDLTRQVIPLASLQGWVARTIDPLQRDPEGIVEQLQSSIPGLSTKLKPMIDPSGAPQLRANRFENAVSPIGMGTSVNAYDQLYRAHMAINQAQKKKTNDAINEAMLAGDEQKAQQIVGDFNTALRSSIADINKKTGDITDLTQKEFDDAFINSDDKYWKSKRTAAEEKNAEAKGEKYVPAAKSTSSKNVFSKSTGIGRGNGGSRGGKTRVSSGRSRGGSTRVSSIKRSGGGLGKIGSLTRPKSIALSKPGTVKLSFSRPRSLSSSRYTYKPTKAYRPKKISYK